MRRLILPCYSNVIEPSLIGSKNFVLCVLMRRTHSKLTIDRNSYTMYQSQQTFGGEASTTRPVSPTRSNSDLPVVEQTTTDRPHSYEVTTETPTTVHSLREQTLVPTDLGIPRPVLEYLEETYSSLFPNWRTHPETREALRTFFRAVADLPCDLPRNEIMPRILVLAIRYLPDAFAQRYTEWYVESNAHNLEPDALSSDSENDELESEPQSDPQDDEPLSPRGYRDMSSSDESDDDSGDVSFFMPTFVGRAQMRTDVDEEDETTVDFDTVQSSAYSRIVQDAHALRIHQNFIQGAPNVGKRRLLYPPDTPLTPSGRVPYSARIKRRRYRDEDWWKWLETSHMPAPTDHNWYHRILVLLRLTVLRGEEASWLRDDLNRRNLRKLETMMPTPGCPTSSKTMLGYFQRLFRAENLMAYFGSSEPYFTMTAPLVITKLDDIQITLSTRGVAGKLNWKAYQLTREAWIHYCNFTREREIAAVSPTMRAQSKAGSKATFDDQIEEVTERLNDFFAFAKVQPKDARAPTRVQKKRQRRRLVIVRKGEKYNARPCDAVVIVSEHAEEHIVRAVSQAYKSAPAGKRTQAVHRALLKSRSSSRNEERDAKDLPIGLYEAFLIGPKMHAQMKGNSEEEQFNAGAHKGSVVGMFESARDDIFKRISALQEESLEALKKGVHQMESTIKGQAQSVAAALQKAKGPAQQGLKMAALATLGSLPTLAIFVYSIYRLKEEFTVGWLLTALATGGILAASVGYAAWSGVHAALQKGLYYQQTRWRPDPYRDASHTGYAQIGEELPAIINTVIEKGKHMAALAAGFLFIGTAPEGKHLQNLMHAASNFSRTSEGLGEMSTAVVRIIEDLINAIRKWVGEDAINLLKATHVETDKWRKDAIDFINSHNRGSMNHDTQNALRALFARFLILSRTFCTGNLHREFDAITKPIYEQLARIKVQFDGSGLENNGAKRRPLWIYFVGGSGTGKTYAALPILREFWLKVLESRSASVKTLEEFKLHPQDWIYTKQIADQYWSGYLTQPIITIDDIGQFILVAGDPGEWSEFLQACTEFAMPLNMPDLPSKGNVYLQGEVIFSTSNVGLDDLEEDLSEVMQVPQAIIRRIDCAIVVYPDIKYRASGWQTKSKLEWKLDPSLIPLDTAYNTDVWRFQTWETYKRVDKSPDESMTYPELVNFLFRQFSERSASTAAYSAQIDLEHQRRTDVAIARAKLREEKAREFTGRATMRPGDTDPSVVTAVLEAAARETLPIPQEPPLGDYPPTEPVSGREMGSNEEHTQPKRKFLDKKLEAMSAVESFLTRVSMYEKTRPVYENETIAEYLSDRENRFNSIAISKIMAGEAIAAVTTPEERQEILNAYVETTVKPDLEKVAACLTHYLQAFSISAEPDPQVVAVMAPNWLTYYNEWHDSTKPEEFQRLMMRSKSRLSLEYQKYQKLKPTKEEEPFQEDPVTVTNWVRFKRFCANTWEKTKDVLSLWFDITGWWGIIGPLVLGAITLFGVVMAITHVWKGSKKETGMTQSTARQVMKRKKNERAPAGHSQIGEGDECSEDAMRMLWSRCQFGFFLSPTAASPIGSCLFLKGKVATFPHHFVTCWQHEISKGKRSLDDVLYVRSLAVAPSVQNSAPITIRELLSARTDPVLKDLDLVSYEFPKRFTDRPDIVDKFVKSSSPLYRQKEMTVSISMLRKGERRVYDTVAALYKNGIWYRGTDSTHTSTMAWQYPFGCDDGDCGDVLLVRHSSSGKEKILGLHVSGDDNQGAATALTRETVERLLSLWGPQTSEDPMPCTGRTNISWGGNPAAPTPAGNIFIPIGTISDGLYNETRTEIRKAFEKCEWMERKKAPAPIGARDAFVRAVEGYGGPALDINEKQVKEAVHQTFCNLAKAVVNQPKIRKRILTDMEAVFGVDGTELPPGVSYTGLQSASSAGWMPGDLAEPNKPHKSTWFYTTQQGEQVVTDRGRALLERVRQNIEMLKLGRRPFFVYKNFLKDELLKKAKVEAGKARFISASPLDLQILFRKYFGMFCAYVTQGRIRNGSAIGVNPHSMEWDTIVKLLREKLSFNAGDFARYDTSLQRLVMMEICEAINRWYDDGPENAMIRRTLFLEIVNSKHIYGKTIYEWLGSEPSGHPLTAVLNTLYTLTFFRLTYGETNPKGFLAMVEYDDHVYTIALGDDHINAVDEYAREFFTPHAIKLVAEKYGMSYTTADKQEITPTTPLQALEDVVFLKRSIRKEPMADRYVAPHDLDSLLEMSLWVRGKTDQERRQNSMSTFDQMMHELSLHSEEVYDLWAPKLLSAYESEFRVPFPIPSRETLLQRVTKGDFFYGVW
jgi:hypothetical protein